ncbi:MAG: phosphoribosylanthranilate isomerase [Bdellovibrionales bacterium]|nr:phosphoribosylanthranilate isomerase [Bdellovibrionales bacterium]
MRVKICGLTRKEDALWAYELGAWALGFIMTPKSPRYLAPKRAELLLSSLPEDILKVGVFVNPSQEEIDRALKIGIQQLQFHGSESLEFCRQQIVPVTKALPLDPTRDFHSQLEVFASLGPVLLDSKLGSQFGGTGQVGDWSLALQASLRFPIILAGGLDPDNIVDAIERVRPFAVDISSGLESSVGKKDKLKMKKLFSRISNHRVES